MIFNCHCENAGCVMEDATVTRHGSVDVGPGGVLGRTTFLERPLCSECGHELTVRGKA